MAAQGPDSFVPNARVDYSQAQAAAPLQIRDTRGQAANTTAAQFRPGTVNYVGAQAVGEDPGVRQEAANWDATGNWLMKAAGEQIAPYVKAYSDSLAMDGIQQVASGKAIQEIIDQQPWYSKIFGDSDLINTARAYKAQEQVSKFTEQVTNAMGSMVTSTPEQAKQFILQAMNNFQTGDTLTDAATNQAMIGASEQLFSQWTKQNYKYRQYEARQSQLGAYASMGDAFDASAKAHYVDGTISADSLNVQAQQLLAGLQPVTGQSPEAWSANVEDTIKGLANRGKFHAVNLLTQSGLLKAFDPDKRAQLDSYIRTQESRVQSDTMASPKYAETIQNFMFNLKTGKQSPADVLVQAQSINAEAQKEFGFTNPMITPKVIQAWMGDATDFSANEYNKAVNMRQEEALRQARATGDQAKKDAITAAKVRDANDMFSHGGPLLPGGDTETLQSIATSRYDYMNQQNPGSGMKSVVGLYLNNGSTGVMKGLKARFNAPLIRAGQTAWTPEFDQAVLPTFNTMMSLPGGQETAVAYYGDNYEKILSYQSSLSAGVPAALAYDSAFVQPTVLGDVSKLSKDETSNLKSVIRDSYQQQFPDFSDFEGLNDAAVATVMNRAQANLARIKNRPGMDTDAKYQEAVRMAFHDGSLALYGQWAWARRRETRPIHEIIGATPQQTYNLMYAQLEDDPLLKGTNLEGAQFVEQNDGDSTSLLVYARDGQGNYKASVITTDDLKRNMAKAISDEQYRSRFRITPQRALGIGQPLPSNMR